MTRTITIEDLYQFKILSRPRMSPDGQRVAFLVTTIDERNHAYRSAIWIIPAQGGEARRLVGSQLANAVASGGADVEVWFTLAQDGQGGKAGRHDRGLCDVSGGQPVQRSLGGYEPDLPAVRGVRRLFRPARVDLVGEYTVDKVPFGGRDAG